MTIQDLLEAGIKLFAIRIVENQNYEIESENYYNSVSDIPKKYKEMEIECMYANKTEYMTIEVKH